MTRNSRSPRRSRTRPAKSASTTPIAPASACWGEPTAPADHPPHPEDGEGDQAKPGGGGEGTEAAITCENHPRPRQLPLHHEQVRSPPDCAAMSGGHGDLLISCGPPPHAKAWGG